MVGLIEMHCPTFLLTLLVNSLNINCVFYIFNNIFLKNSFEPFEKAFISIFKINYMLILENYNSPDLKDKILMKTTYDRLRHMMEKITIAPEARQ